MFEIKVVLTFGVDQTGDTNTEFRQILLKSLVGTGHFKIKI